VKISCSTIENKYLRIKTLNIGATLFEVFHKDKKVNLILNLGSKDNYKSKNFYVGSTCGRFAGRISKSIFIIGSKKYKLSNNEGKNLLHGGKKGFDRLIWKKTKHSKQKIVYKIQSPHLDQGFPGNLLVKCIFELKKNNFFIKYEYVSDKLTHVNLTNHSYWNLNLNKKKNIFNHDLKINANQYLDVNNYLIPTSKIKSVNNSINDFRKYSNIGNKIKLNSIKKIKKISKTIDQSGFDLTYVKNKKPGNFIASLKNKESKIKIDLYTDLPGVQLYTSQSLKYKKKLFPYQGVCLETQFFPESPNINKFPSTLIKPKKIYKYFTKFNIQKLNK
jgi:aldose 1-epimerase|tara:strand:- start:948 stop:1943 length:996 start_codon:yes stop_codon:yes gene_type:complete